MTWQQCGFAEGWHDSCSSEHVVLLFLGESLVTGAALWLTIKSDLCQDIFALELIHQALKPQTATPFLNGYASRPCFESSSETIRVDPRTRSQGPLLCFLAVCFDLCQLFPPSGRQRKLSNLCEHAPAGDTSSAPARCSHGCVTRMNLRTPPEHLYPQCS